MGCEKHKDRAVCGVSVLGVCEFGWGKDALIEGDTPLSHEKMSTLPPW